MDKHIPDAFSRSGDVDPRLNRPHDFLRHQLSKIDYYAAVRLRNMAPRGPLVQIDADLHRDSFRRAQAPS
jgi:hypothetical protein